MAKTITCSCGTKAGNHERARWAHLARTGSQSERRIRFILPARGFSQIINTVLAWTPSIHKFACGYNRKRTNEDD